MRTEFKKGDKVVIKECVKNAVLSDEKLKDNGISDGLKILNDLNINETFEVSEFTFWNTENECHDIRIGNKIRYDVSWFELANEVIGAEDF